MSRALKITLALLVVGVAVGAIYLRGLHQRVLRLARVERTEQQAHREVTQPPIATPSDVKVKAKIFWASKTQPGAVEPVEVELPLSADPVQRARQVINALIATPPSADQRVLPADVTLLEFYLLADGTAIADFSGALAATTPSGILSEQAAVEAIARTLEANVENIRRLKILINGQEAETLAGHVDLTDFFELRPAPSPRAAAGLTPATTPGKLGR